MNFDSANFFSLLPANQTIQGIAQPLPGFGFSADFAAAMLAQMKLLGTEASQGELLETGQATSPSANLQKLQNLADWLGEGGDMQELAAFFGKELPLSHQVVGAADSEPVELVVPEALNISTTVAAGELQSLRHSDGEQPAAPVQENVATKGQAEIGEIMAAIQAQNMPAGDGSAVVATTCDLPNSKEANFRSQPAPGAGEDTTELAALVTAIMAPAAIPVEKTAEQGITSSDLKIDRQAFVQSKIMTVENNHSPSSVGKNNGISDSFFPARLAEPGSEPVKPAFNLTELAKTDFVVKNGEAEFNFVLDPEKNSLRAGAEISQLSRHSVEIKAEVPALTKPITHPDWNKDLGDRILWMNSKSIPAAEIKLNPPHLGPISVRIDVNQDQASISFAAQHGAVREALEASIPKLRDMMGAQQINLLDVNVSQHFSSDQGRPQPQNFGPTTENPGPTGAESPVETIAESDRQSAVVSKGLLSIYA